MDIRRTVLLADANEEFRALVRKIIDQTDEFAVVGSVGDGAEALRLARQEAPDLILMDVVLPGLDGFGVLKQLREQEGKVPKVILISAFCSDSVVSEAVDLGASYFLTKPVEENALLDRMRALFGRDLPEERHPVELKNLVKASFSITVEQASRFLDDYLTGDHYFRYEYPKHNLVRARCQLQLAKDIEKKWSELEWIIQDVIDQLGNN